MVTLKHLSRKIYLVVAPKPEPHRHPKIPRPRFSCIEETPNNYCEMKLLHWMVFLACPAIKLTL